MVVNVALSLYYLVALFDPCFVARFGMSAAISGSIAAVNAAAVLVCAALIGFVDDAVGHARPVQVAGIAVVVGPFLGNVDVGTFANIYIIVLRYGYGIGRTVALMAGAGGGCVIAVTAAICAVAVLVNTVFGNLVAVAGGNTRPVQAA